MISYNVLGTRQVVAYSPSALSAILHSKNFILPPRALNFNKTILGGGILTVEHDEHKQQRRIMAPAFGIGHIREITAQLWYTANQFAECLAVEVEKQTNKGIEVMTWMDKVSLDLMGLAGSDLHNGIDI